MRKKLLRLVCPLMAGNEYDPMGEETQAPEFCETLTGATPGERVNSCVKLRPFSGRSTTCRLLTTAPTSAVDAWMSAPTASTVTDCSTPPTFRVRSNVAV